MEAQGELPPRAQAKLRKAARTGVSVPENAKPNVQPWSGGIGDASSRTLLALTQGELTGSQRVGGSEDNDDPTMSGEKSDHSVVARKPGNAGGAKGVTE